jgi:3-deoxy-manno-octulosonate cytidylyltransferase (CMP-KDO synthetase)
MATPPPALAVIPARFASTRLPGKPLLDRTGKPLIQHVVQAAAGAESIDRLIVATDDDRIAAAVARFAGDVTKPTRAMMTSADHPNGTSRLAEVVQQLGAEAPDVIVNVQGDEPWIEPGVIDRLVQAMHDDPDAAMGTVASPFAQGEDPASPHIVKVVCDTAGRALYFSRAAIPHHRDPSTGPPTLLKHIGLYAYRREFLPQYAALTATALEQAEQLEQLRALERGHRITVIQAHVDHHGIDTPEQYDAFVKAWRKRHANS